MLMVIMTVIMLMQILMSSERRKEKNKAREETARKGCQGNEDLIDLMVETDRREYFSQIIPPLYRHLMILRMPAS